MSETEPRSTDPQCLLEEETCPTSCDLYPQAVALASERGGESMRAQRESYMFGDSSEDRDGIASMCELAQIQAQSKKAENPWLSVINANKDRVPQSPRSDTRFELRKNRNKRSNKSI